MRGYWIQQKAPAGNYVDHVGLGNVPESQAHERLMGYRKQYPQQTHRLVWRVDLIIDGETMPGEESRYGHDEERL